MSEYQYYEFRSLDRELTDREIDALEAISTRAQVTPASFTNLYLGWLLCLQNEEFDDEEPASPVPAGFGELSKPLRSLIDFLDVNQDLIEAAAAASEPLPARPGRKQLDKWVRALPEQDKNRVLTTAFLQSGDNWKNETLHRFHLENRLVNSSPKKLQFRTVGDLRSAA